MSFAPQYLHRPLNNKETVPPMSWVSWPSLSYMALHPVLYNSKKQVALIQKSYQDQSLCVDRISIYLDIEVKMMHFLSN